MAELIPTLRKLFGEPLGRAELGVTESFFAAGGDSLAAAEVLARIESELGVELQYRDFLEAPTPARLALTILLARGDDLAAAIGALSAEDAAVLVAELEKR